MLPIVGLEILNNSLIKRLISAYTISWKLTDSNIQRRRANFDSRVVYQEVVHCQKDLAYYSNMLIEFLKLFTHNRYIYPSLLILSPSSAYSCYTNTLQSSQSLVFSNNLNRSSIRSSSINTNTKRYSRFLLLYPRQILRKEPVRRQHFLV